MTVHCWWHNEITLVLILRQLNPLHNLQPKWLHFILILSSHLHKVWPGGLFPSNLPTETLYYYPNSPMHTTWLIKLILILIQCGTLCKSWNSSVHIFIKLPVTCPPSPSQLKYPPQHPVLNSLTVCSSYNERSTLTLIQYIQKISHFRSLTKDFKLNGTVPKISCI